MFVSQAKVRNLQQDKQWLEENITQTTEKMAALRKKLEQYEKAVSVQERDREWQRELVIMLATCIPVHLI